MTLKITIYFISCFFIIFGQILALDRFEVNILKFAPILIMHLYLYLSLLQEIVFSHENIIGRATSVFTKLAKSWFVKSVFILTIFQFINFGFEYKTYEDEAFKRILGIDLISTGFLFFMLYKNYLDWKKEVVEKSINAR